MSIKKLKTTKINWDIDGPILQRKINELVERVNRIAKYLFCECTTIPDVNPFVDEFSGAHSTLRDAHGFPIKITKEEQVLKEIREFGSQPTTFEEGWKQITRWQRMLN